MGKVCQDCMDKCEGGCTSCSGKCEGGCTSCSGNCSWSCTGGCLQSCSGTCDNSCDNSCSGTCSGGCSNGCINQCTGTCLGACNFGCTNTEQSEAYAALSLITLIDADNINNVINFINNEILRRGNTPISVNEIINTTVLASDITKIQANLARAGQTTNNVAEKNELILQVLGQELIAKAKAAYEEVIGLT